MHPNVHCITIYHSHDMQHFFNYSKNGKNKTNKKKYWADVYLNISYFYAGGNDIFYFNFKLFIAGILKR